MVAPIFVRRRTRAHSAPLDSPHIIKYLHTRTHNEEKKKKPEQTQMNINNSCARVTFRCLLEWNANSLDLIEFVI